jgi:hypothetical protein
MIEHNGVLEMMRVHLLVCSCGRPLGGEEF